MWRGNRAAIEADVLEAEVIGHDHQHVGLFGRYCRKDQQRQSRANRPADE